MTAMVHHHGWADPFTLRTLCELPMLAAVLLAFGVAAFAAAVLPDQSESGCAPAGLWMVLRGVSLLALIMAPLQLMSAAASMAGVAFDQALSVIPQVMRETRFGAIWIANGPILLALAGAAWIPGRSRARAALIALLAVALLALRTLVSHAIDFGAAATLLYFVHEAAAGLWGGALLGMWSIGRHESIRKQAADLIIRRVSRLAGWCVAALAVSGVYIGYCALGLNLDHLLYSAYGRTLVAKVAAFAILTGFGGYNRYWLVPRIEAAPVRGELIQSIQVECVLMLAVLALAVLLANTPPAH